MELLDENKKPVSVEQFIDHCPYVKSILASSTTVNPKKIQNMTQQCFDILNQRLSKPSQVQQQGGGHMKSLDSHINQLYENLRRYLDLHNLQSVNSKTLLPYGAIVSALQLLPKDPEVLSELYPDLKEWSENHHNSFPPKFDLRVPIGIFLNEADLKKINKN